MPAISRSSRKGMRGYAPQTGHLYSPCALPIAVGPLCSTSITVLYGPLGRLVGSFVSACRRGPGTPFTIATPPNAWAIQILMCGQD